MTSVRPLSAGSGTDPWDQAPSTSSRRPPAAKAKSQKKAAVRDDWEDEEDEEEEGGAEPTVESNQKLWNAANAQTPTPMPAIIPSASATHPMTSPPPAAFQPALKILKRPSNAGPSASPPPLVNQQSFQEREARYLAARERIFGSGSSSTDGSTSSLSQKKEEGIKPARQPKGPEDSDQREKGFKGRSDRSNYNPTGPPHGPPS
ncbi:hypothetical protein HDZ31DRAFT_66401 [Schizophyllum fasciatum]